MDSYWVLSILIVALSVVQSLFGVGLLLFGTPLLLFSGYSFVDALWLLLPCSLAVSIAQVVNGRTTEGARAYLIYAIPALVVGLLVNLGGSGKLRIDLWVAGLLFISVCMRHTSSLKDWLRRSMVRHRRLALVAIGLVHGLTNMGGTLLTIYVGSQQRDRFATSRLVAMGYAIFAASQLVVLTITRPPPKLEMILFYPFLALFTYLFIGRRSLKVINDSIYYKALSGFMVLCGMLLVYRV